MHRLKLLLPIYLAALLGVFAIGPALAADADLTTPEGAVAAYLEGVARQDFTAVMAVTSVDAMSKGVDFVAYIDRLGALTPTAPAPADTPFFVAVNQANMTAQIARQIQFLVYGLMTTSEVLDGKTVKMDAAGATAFASAVRADRLAGLSVVKVGIPNPKIVNSERYQANAARIAHMYGADAWTERLALVSFEGLSFVLGFSLLRYGDDWTIHSQSSPAAGTTSLGAPKRVTPEAFEDMIQ